MSSRSNFRDAAFTRLYPATPDPRGFFESVLGFENLADTYIRVTAADQKRYFGYTPFGRTAVKVAENGILTLAKTKAFGTDSDTSDFVYDHDQRGFRQTFEGSPLVKYPSLAL